MSRIDQLETELTDVRYARHYEAATQEQRAELSARERALVAAVDVEIRRLAAGGRV